MIGTKQCDMNCLYCLRSQSNLAVSGLEVDGVGVVTGITVHSQWSDFIIQLFQALYY